MHKVHEALSQKPNQMKQSYLPQPIFEGYGRRRGKTQSQNAGLLDQCLQEGTVCFVAINLLNWIMFTWA